MVERALPDHNQLSMALPTASPPGPGPNCIQTSAFRFESTSPRLVLVSYLQYCDIKRHTPRTKHT